MTAEINSKGEFPKGKRVAKYSRVALQAIGGAVPFAGGIFSAVAGAWRRRGTGEGKSVF